jgi:hypothetical protein
MRAETWNSALAFVAAGAVTLVVLVPTPARAHCDTLDGPVVQDARTALAAGDVTPALKWVPADREAEIRHAFARARAVRDLGPDARALADRFFFETLVRVHRDGEGAPYTGLKPGGTVVDPTILAADSALETGDVEPLLEQVTHLVERGLRERHAHAVETRRRAQMSVEEGRRYVAAYVDFVHYAEAVAAAGPAPHPPATSGPHGH